MKTKSIFMACAMALVVAAGASAQENKKSNVLTVATVNIYNATLLSQSPSGEFTISFDLNNREGIQSNVRYSVNLTQQAGGKSIVLDKKIYDENIILQQDETIQKKILYTPPRFLNGTYSLTVEARNSEGLVLGIADVGDVTLSGSGQSVVIYQNSCYLSVEGDEKNTKYELEQGLNIKPGYDIALNCEIENKVGRDVSIKPSITTYYRSAFGKVLSQQANEPIALKNGARTLISFSIPKQADPQSYEVVVYFLDEDSNPISEKITADYTIAGEGATIQNVKFDKNSYQKGETAKVSFFYLDLANNFSDKSDTQQQSDLNVEIDIKNQNSEQCAPLFKKKLTVEAFSIFDIAMTQNCTNPIANVVIKDDEGKVLARALFETSSEQKSQQVPTDTKNSPDELKIASKSILLGASIFALVVVILAAIFFRKRKNGQAMIWLLGFVFAGLACGGGAKGDTFTTRNGFHVFTYPVGAIGGWANITWNVSLNKAQFLTNEPMAVSSQVSSPLPFSLLIGRSIALDGNINGTTKRIGTVSSGSSFVFPVANWNAQSSAGSYNAEFMMSSSFDGTSRFYIPYTVVGSTVNGACGSSGPFATLSGTEAYLCQFGNIINFTGSGPWSWICQGTGIGHTDAPCTASKTCIPSYSGHICPSISSIDCGDPANCGKPVTNNPICSALNSCTHGTDSLLPADCVAAGQPCATTTSTCPACPPEANYKEVAP